MLSLLAKPLPDKVVDQKSTFVLSLKLILSQIANGVESLFLDALQDLIFGLIILVDRINDLDWVGLPSTLIKL